MISKPEFHQFAYTVGCKRCPGKTIDLVRGLITGCVGFALNYFQIHCAAWRIELFALPAIQDCIDQHVLLGKRTNPDIRCVGISVNTSALPTEKRLDYLASLSEETGLPCVDSMIDGCGAIVENIKKQFPEG